MRIERRAAAAGAPASAPHPTASRSITRKPALRFRGGVCPAIVRRFDLQVFPHLAAIAVFVLHPEIGELHAVIDTGQRMDQRPAIDLVLVTKRDTLAVVAASVRLLQEPLVLSFEFIVQDEHRIVRERADS